MDNIAQALIENVKIYPQRTALIAKGSSGYLNWTFKELYIQVSRYVETLKEQGVKPGDRVILMVRPSLEFIALTYALFSLGAVVILIDPGMGYKNLLKCIGSVKPDVFIGIAKAHLFRKLFPAPFRTVKKAFSPGMSFGLFGKSLKTSADFKAGTIKPYPALKDDLAAIIFTTGSTGPPKGVQYTHGIFQAQLQMIRDYYLIQAGDVDQPAFPLFALFSTALGATAVIPDMDPTKPAKVNPLKFIKTINDHRVTYSFGSPAIWNVVSNYCLAENIRLPSLKKILMAGAPVSGELIERTKKIISDDGEIYTPYGATECLPIVSMPGTEIVNDTWPLTKMGKGTCVGRPLPGIDIRIIKATTTPIDNINDSLVIDDGEVGEIIVKGQVVTKAYDNNEQENRLSKIKDKDGGFWHRIGDMGYLDTLGRLWFCGRKAHTVKTLAGPMYTICCEAVFNNHKDVCRSALVAIDGGHDKIPLIIVEPNKKITDSGKLFSELKKIAEQYEHTRNIERFLIHESFPVDIRHNAKIFREKLTVWAARQLI